MRNFFALARKARLNSGFRRNDKLRYVDEKQHLLEKEIPAFTGMTGKQLKYKSINPAH